MIRDATQDVESDLSDRLDSLREPLSSATESEIEINRPNSDHENRNFSFFGGAPSIGTAHFFPVL